MLRENWDNSGLKFKMCSQFFGLYIIKEQEFKKISDDLVTIGADTYLTQ